MRFLSRAAPVLAHTALWAVILLALASCHDLGSDPPQPEHAGRQFPISWPSLANSPWPMNHGDPQSTGRSILLGPVLAEGPRALFTSRLGYRGGVAVTADSLLLAGVFMTAFAMNDSIRWVYTPSSEWFITTPIVRHDGVIVAATWGGEVMAVNPNGTLRWVLTTGDAFDNQGSNIGLDGTFYCLGRLGTVYAVSTTGQMLWNLNDPQFTGNHRSVLTFSPDGNILYVPGKGVAVNAVDVRTHTVRWRFGASEMLRTAPLVDSQGNVYVLATNPPEVIEQSLISIRPDGTMRWAYVHGNDFDQVNAGDPTIDADGNIYFAFDTLYCVGWQGELRWKQSLDIIQPQPFCDVPLVCDAANNVYAIVTAGGSYVSEIAIFGSDGSLLGRQIAEPTTYWLDSSPAIYWDRRLAVAGWKTNIVYVFK